MNREEGGNIWERLYIDRSENSLKAKPHTHFSKKPDPVVFAGSENQDQCQKSLMLIVFLFAVHCASHRECQPYLKPAADKEPSSDDCALH